MHTIKLKYMTVTGDVTKAEYRDGTLAVVFADGTPDREVLSANLSTYGLVPQQPDTFYARDYGAWEGMPDALVEAGIASKVGPPVTFGPFQSSAQLMKVEI